MLGRVILYVLLLWLFSLVAYGCYKLLWYGIKILLFPGLMKRLSKVGVEVEPQRSFLNMIFGQRGKVDYILTHQGKRYAISVISMISTHGRWNIEKTRTQYLIESRRFSKIFYNRYVNSSVPDHVAEYKKELRLSRKEFYISPPDAAFDKQIFLLYPYPKCITYTDAHYHELYVGDKVEGHMIMDIRALENLFSGEK